MIPGLDGLRAIALLAVLGAHTGNFDFGWMGVQLFFVLSGFLITGILLQMKEHLPAKEYFYKFYGRRFLRIFPLYYLFLFILTAITRYSDLIPMKFMQRELQNVVHPQLPYAYFYIYDFFHASSSFQATRFLAHLWSLSVEEQFYIIWPMVLFFTPKEKIKNLFLFTIVLGPILRVLAYFAYSSHMAAPPLDNPYLGIYVLPFSHVDAFAMGAYISEFQLPHPQRQLAILALCIPTLGFYTQYLAVGKILPDTLGYESTLYTAYKFVWGYSLLNYFFGLIIHTIHQTRLFIGVLDSFPLKYLGKISYGLYVYHLPVVWFIVEFQLKYRDTLDLSMDFGSARVYVLALIITTIIASLSFYLIEKPVVNLKGKLFPLR